MEFIAALARQPLFQLLGAIVILLLADMRPAYGIAGLVVWALWIYVGRQWTGQRRAF